MSEPRQDNKKAGDNLAFELRDTVPETVPCPRPLKAAAAAECDLLQIPGYRILKKIGEGGMGAVFLANQDALDRTVAVKMLPRRIAKEDKQFAERFKREARALAKLNHPNIVSIYDYGQTVDGLFYYVMEYVDGANVARIIHNRGQSIPQALEIVKQACDALAYAHRCGVIHRDVKPSNLLVDRFGQVKVADFGLARLVAPVGTLESRTTRPEAVMGTPEYMAPEQAQSSACVDHRADIFSIGVMLYELLTGELPRGNFKPPSSKIPGLDAQIDKITSKALEPDAVNRFQSASDIKNQLDEVLERMSWPNTPRPRTSHRPVGFRIWRKKEMAAVAGIILLGLSGLAYFSLNKKLGSPFSSSDDSAEIRALFDIAKSAFGTLPKPVLEQRSLKEAKPQPDPLRPKNELPPPPSEPVTVTIPARIVKPVSLFPPYRDPANHGPGKITGNPQNEALIPCPPVVVPGPISRTRPDLEAHSGIKIGVPRVVPPPDESFNRPKPINPLKAK